MAEPRTIADRSTLHHAEAAPGFGAMDGAVPGAVSATATPYRSPHREWREALLLALLIGLLLSWPATEVITKASFRTLPSGAGNGADFAIFLGAARVVQQGGNPYDHALLYRTERRMLHDQGVRITPRQDIARVGNPPLFFWLLQPLNRIPFPLAALGWMAAMLLLSAAGLLAVLHAFGWQRRWLACLLFACTPQTVANIYHANNISLVFAAVALSLLLWQRHPFIAGAVLSAAWLKPQVGLPAVLLIALLPPHGRARLLGGFVGGTALLGAATCLVMGPDSLAQWIDGMVGVNSNIAEQTAIPSLAGGYVVWASPALRLVLSAGGLLGAGLLTVLQWRRSHGLHASDLRPWAVLWFVWFLATPYTHITDEILLAIPLVALLGPNARRIRQALPAMALVCLFVTSLPWPYSRAALPLPILILLLTGEGRERVPIWPVAAVCALLALSALSHEVSIPANGQFLSLSATAICLGSMVPRPMPLGGERPEVSPDREAHPGAPRRPILREWNRMPLPLRDQN